eukprot:833336-Amphidinium_carterae.1
MGREGCIEGLSCDLRALQDLPNPQKLTGGPKEVKKRSKIELKDLAEAISVAKICGVETAIKCQCLSSRAKSYKSTPSPTQKPYS